MFSERLRELRNEKEISQKELAAELFVSQQTVAKWETDRSTPNPEMISKIAQYFEVSSDYLLGISNLKSAAVKNSEAADENKKMSVLNKKDERQIEKILERAKKELTSQEGLMFDGDPASPEAIESILSAMELGLQAAKMKNKEKYTPKKYKKG